VKRGRGRPSKASLAAAAAAAPNKSLCSLGTSINSSVNPVSVYSSPLISNVTTPTPVDNAKPTQLTRSGNLVAATPAVKSHGSGTTSTLKADNQYTVKNYEVKLICCLYGTIKTLEARLFVFKMIIF
jgi:hypothetical protein